MQALRAVYLFGRVVVAVSNGNIQEAKAVGVKMDQTRITRAIGVALGMGADARFRDMYLRCNAPDTQQRPCKES
jgi:uncharacterized protein (DUF697 family)